jgi:23S rRNA (adenine2503-C2)-methyltransferase
MVERVALYDLTHKELADLLATWGEPRFRADQVWRWLYKSLAADFETMGNLPAPLRARLNQGAVISPLTPVAEQVSSSGETRKVLFRLADGNTIETVLMLYHDRRTVCVSTQVGCGMGCTFCATGQGGLARNLTSGEILAQVLQYGSEIQQTSIREAQALGVKANLDVQPVTNIVLMGMGEPLANYAATWQAIETMTDDGGYNLGARRITLSTVGLVPGIQRLTEEEIPINLAVSLHAASDELRDQLVPLNLRYPLADLLAAVQAHIQKTGRRVTVEYALIAGLNDNVDQARQLASLLAGLLCHVNIIPLNPTPGSPLRPSAREQVHAFRDELEGAGIPVTVRVRRGIDIEAGCGQLRQQQSDDI